jgi:hypothetical protein
MKGIAMSLISSEKGIALVTALMFTMLALVISMSLLYMVTSGIRTSGALKQYKTTIEASYGGAEIIVKDIFPTAFAFRDYSSGSNPFGIYLKNSMGTLSSSASVSDCFRQRLTNSRSQWTGACANISMNPKESPDVTFSLNGASGTQLAVYTKIVDTMDRKFTVLANGVPTVINKAGNSDTSSFVLDGGSTSEAGAVTVPQNPYIYRIEIQGERQQNSAEKANLSVQYAY